ncbi:uncharacterized protein SPPG_06060 [Spizellomyces punctatus DAOM BR117]|uniref:Glycosyltransferase 61 catalytic domain-containing protein n=1 Tax=Spizellomyces punctatus (strain DAOM BR117) TaxID=645134 RepID=A0A0L0HBN5_SPIPD|nr:uncharacterized protein SPPG_06060 [Spizellomyces punctatus DAOM BR117]KNC98351.1 hypothetical protein SPPG_06060 [Spizellomyces punctatus DAOM BR117]|eukprot:XP_016606391.1 hypothetical protein SPPG_06060 [Spizellomyces punctatus DAOM BR117]
MKTKKVIILQVLLVTIFVGTYIAGSRTTTSTLTVLRVPRSVEVESRQDSVPQSKPRILNNATNGQESKKWAPYVYSSCDSTWMPAHFAPCIKERMNQGSSCSLNPTAPCIAEAEELIFPDFEIREPGFHNATYRNYWVSSVTDPRRDFHGRMHWVHNGWARYSGQFGQNFILTNAGYEATPLADSWSAGACMAWDTDFSAMLRPVANGAAKKVRKALFAASPDSWSFQHFLDRTTHLAIQAGEHIDTDTYVVSGAKQRQEPVKEMWNLAFGVKADHLVSSPITAETLIFPCRSVLIHPYFQIRFAELMGVARTRPMSERKVVLYLSRNQDNTLNGGRRIVNEDALLSAVTKLVEERQQGEELVIYDHRKFSTMQEVVSFWSSVRAVFGPHGSAFHNHWFAPKNTMLIEFVPRDRFQILWWEQSALLGQTYWPFALASENAQHDMKVPVDAVVSILRENLGKIPEPVLRKYYPWDTGY